MVEPCRKEADMATKAFTIFSTNPKMDTSGVKAKMPQMGYDMRRLPPKEITGGKLYMKAAGNQPIWIAIKPLIKPSAESENATGNPISMITISPANIRGAKSCMVIAAVSRSAYPSDKRYLTRRRA